MCVHDGVTQKTNKMTAIDKRTIGGFGVTACHNQTTTNSDQLIINFNIVLGADICEY
jgi:hypothetical protein